MKLLKEESGQTLVLMAIFMGVVAVGFVALAVDAGYLFHEKRMAQAAADSAALAYSEERAYSTTSAQNAANAMAKLNGFDTTLATNPATVTTTTPSTGNFTGSSYVQVTVSKPISTVFLAAFRPGMAAMTVSASAIAGGAASSQTCVCVEGTSNNDLSVTGGSSLTASGCGIVADSSASNAITVSGGSDLVALSVGSLSTSWFPSQVFGGSLLTSSHIVQGIGSGCTPTMPSAPTYSSCVADPGGSWGTFTWGPTSANAVICYNGLTVGANGSTCTLLPGIYVINGGHLHFESGSGGYSNLGGQGVFFYLTNNATLEIDNGANVNLVAGGGTESGGGTAPTVGSYNGILLYQDPSDTQTLTISGGTNFYTSGSIYAPSAAINVSGGSSFAVNVNGGIVAASLSISGGSKLVATATTNEGSLSFGSSKLVQ